MTELKRDKTMVLPVVAWLAEDGRVATDETKRTAMTRHSREMFLIPLCRVQDAIASINTCEVTAGWAPAMLQDDSRGLSKWLSDKPNALQHVKAAQAAHSPPIQVGVIVDFEGEKFRVVCKGDIQDTFDLHVHPQTRSGDQWRNVPPSKLKLVTPQEKS